MSTDDLSDDLLRLIDLEVTRMKEYADDNREMLEKVARRQHLWMEFLQHEVGLILSLDKGWAHRHSEQGRSWVEVCMRVSVCMHACVSQYTLIIFYPGC